MQEPEVRSGSAKKLRCPKPGTNEVHPRPDLQDRWLQDWVRIDLDDAAARSNIDVCISQFLSDAAAFHPVDHVAMGNIYHQLALFEKEVSRDRHLPSREVEFYRNAFNEYAQSPSNVTCQIFEQVIVNLFLLLIRDGERHQARSFADEIVAGYGGEEKLPVSVFVQFRRCRWVVSLFICSRFNSTDPCFCRFR